MADALLYNAIVQRNQEMITEINEAVIGELEAVLSDTPWDPTGWVLLPYDDSAAPSDQVYVCDASGNFRCGASCSWTVPAGATTAMFQAWGSGAYTGTGCCCGGTAYGNSGAYVVAVATVTPGDVFTLCAGCSPDCYPSRGIGTVITCGSFVCGTGITLCAAGACTGVLRQMCMIHNGTCGRFQARGNTASGACICNGGTDYCFASSCATCGIVENIADTDLRYSATLTVAGCACGLPSLMPVTCFDTNHYGYKIRQPVIAPNHTVALNTCQCCSTYTSGTCCGGCICSAANGFTQVFGAGGTYTHVMGGGNSNCGDAGRGGLVRVSWWS